MSDKSDTNRTITRRQFARTTAFGLGVAPIFGRASLPLIAPERRWLPDSDKLGIALVGLGSYSTWQLAPALEQTGRCKLAGIVTGTPSKAASWQEKHPELKGHVYSYETFDRIADDDAIDIVYVVLPNSMHAEYTIRAARAGKHVWCEKPMAMSVAECQAMIDACRSNKVSLSIGYRMQHEPNTQEVIRIGRERVFGKPTLVKASAGYYDGRSDHWKQKKEMGGGALYDMGVYPLNAARYCTGEEPVAVIQASHSTKRPEIYTEVDETTRFELEFPSGARAECATSLGMGMNDLQVDYESGWARLSPFQSYSGIRVEASDGRRFDAGIPSQQARQMDDDALSIMEGRPMLVPGEEGLRDIRVVEAIYEAARTKERVVIY